MNILWSVNTVIPDIAEKLNLRKGHSISWVDAMRTELIKDKDSTKLAIVCHGGFRTRTLLKYVDDNAIYYILPFDCEWKNYWDSILTEFKPDIIHIYGTERKHNISLIDAYNEKIPIVISLQGIISEYVKHYYAGISKKEIIRNYTLKDVICHNGIFEGRRKFLRQSKIEEYMFKHIKYVEGRSDWDYATVMNINPALKYYYCPRMIRTPFFNYSWEEKSLITHSVFVHQGDYPIKGLHFMIDALAILKRNYPDIKLFVSGNDIFSSKGLNEKGYIKFIKRKIKMNQLEGSIHFTGYLNADQLAKRLTSMSVCVIPSAIENAPNALAEAMLVGTPIVASYVGGNAEMLNYGECGLLYCYDEPQMLANRISNCFENHESSITRANRGRTIAKDRHNPETLKNTLLALYQDICSDFIKRQHK